MLFNCSHDLVSCGPHRFAFSVILMILSKHEKVWRAAQCSDCTPLTLTNHDTEGVGDRAVESALVHLYTAFVKQSDGSLLRTPALREVVAGYSACSVP
jgi:hypothetical protein